MKIVIKKPGIKFPKVKTADKSFSFMDSLKYIYDYENFSRRYLPPTLVKLVIFTLISSLITFSTYFLTSYIRANNLAFNEIVEQVVFLNYAMWGAYLMFVLGINLLLVLLFRLLKIEQNDIKFLLNQITIAVGAYLFMRIVAMLIILADEKLPFEINIEYSFFNFNLLTVLFVAQITVALLVYNYLLLNLPERFRNKKLITMFVAVIYVASLWTLIAP
jgi:hypothetical protein